MDIARKIEDLKTAAMPPEYYDRTMLEVITELNEENKSLKFRVDKSYELLERLEAVTFSKPVESESQRRYNALFHIIEKVNSDKQYNHLMQEIYDIAKGAIDAPT